MGIFGNWFNSRKEDVNNYSESKNAAEYIGGMDSNIAKIRGKNILLNRRKLALLFYALNTTNRFNKTTVKKLQKAAQIEDSEIPLEQNIDSFISAVKTDINMQIKQFALLIGACKNHNAAAPEIKKLSETSVGKYETLFNNEVVTFRSASDMVNQFINSVDRRSEQLVNNILTRELEALEKKDLKEFIDIFGIGDDKKNTERSAYREMSRESANVKRVLEKCKELALNARKDMFTHIQYDLFILGVGAGLIACLAGFVETTINGPDHDRLYEVARVFLIFIVANWIVGALRDNKSFPNIFQAISRI